MSVLALDVAGYERGEGASKRVQGKGLVEMTNSAS